MNNFEKEFVPYTEALELKQLGFDEPCMASRDMNNKEGIIQIPLYQQAFRWFRENYKLHHEVACGDNVFWFRYGSNGHVAVLSIDTNNDSYWATYEEAELACLRKLIEIVKQKQQ